MSIYKILKRDNYWAIVRELPDGFRVVAHVGKPDYISKLWAEKYSTATKRVTR